MPDLILVKHSLPEIPPPQAGSWTPPSQWLLSDEGRHRCDLLARALDRHAPSAIVSSREPKALETAELIGDRLGLEATVVEGLHEHERDDVGRLDRDALEAGVAALFGQPSQLVFGSETAEAALERFEQAVMNVIAAHPDQTIVVVSHGTVISQFVASVAGVDPYPLWLRLGLPSFVVLALPGMALVRVVEGVSP